MKIRYTENGVTKTITTDTIDLFTGDSSFTIKSNGDGMRVMVSGFRGKLSDRISIVPHSVNMVTITPQKEAG